MLLSLRELSKSYSGVRAVSGVSFDVAHGETVAVLGPSGCGKSTILAMLAGIIAPDQGDILWEGGSILSTPVHLRGFGMMFQDYALFPHLTVKENVAFGLTLRTREPYPAEIIESRTRQMLEWVGLEAYRDRDVFSLSGGEQQRVALARALAPEPRLLMLDEPLGALDRALREQLVLELKDILRQAQQTTIYVTHDQEEAYALADRLVVMNAGRVEQVGTPQHVYAWPRSEVVARFLGLTNLLDGRAFVEAGQAWVDTEIGRFPLLEPASGLVRVLLRPDTVQLEEGGDCHLEGEIISYSYRGSSYRFMLAVRGLQLTFELPFANHKLAVGQRVCIWLNSHRAVQIIPRA